MKRRIGPLLLVVGILCLSCAWAQNDTGTSDNPAPTQPGPKPAFTYPDTTPSLDFLTGSIENSSITLGITAGFAYDSNGYPNSTTTENRWLFNVAPSIKIQQFLPRLAWHAAYAGGLQVYDQVTGPSSQGSNLYSQTASGGFLWQLARRWQLAGDDSFRYSANPFDSYLTTPGTPTINNPNPVSYYPLSNFTQNNAYLTLTDQLTKRDTLAFTGTENYRSTSKYNLLTSVPFYNLVSYGGRTDYSHELSQRLTLGVGYDFNSLDFGHGQQRSGIQTITLTGSYLITPNMTISGWVGPEYTSTKTIVGIPILGVIYYITDYNSLWSTALGANFGWRSLRNSVRAGFIRSVTDGGGIIATSQSNIVTATYRRLITQKWSAQLGARYSHNVSTTTSSRSFNNYYVDVGLVYQIAKAFNATATYARVHQVQSNAFLIGSGSYNDNRVGVSLTYTWDHPLGR